MFSIFIAVVMVITAIALRFTLPVQLPRNGIAAGIIFLSAIVGVSGAVSYNDAGYCSHIKTVFGTESSKCDLGWYFSGWGSSTKWPLTITIANVAKPESVSVDSHSAYIDGPYRVKLADNWAGDITQSTRFNLPQNEEKFLRMARELRTPENLIASTLVPSVKASLDTTANLFTMEEYYSGGQRDAFKNEYRDTVTSGPAATEKITDEIEIQKRVAPSSSDNTADKSETASETNMTIVEKKTDEHGRDIRNNPPAYTQYGIVVSSAIVENLDPDNAYEAQVVKRKEALGRRVIARDQRAEQEEQRLLKIAEADSAIAEEQGLAKKQQIKQTTNAETEKKLALINAEKLQSQADIERKTAQINFEKAKIDAEAKIVSAQADAKARELAIQADNALQSKINAEIEIQKAWASAYATRNVPSIVMGGSNGAPTGSDQEVSTLLNLLTANTAKNLAYDRSLAEPLKK